MQTHFEMHHLILDWFSRKGRVFPWRYDSPDPYHVLISEYMLQQTQTTRIAERYPIFLAKFPNILSLSKASNQEIILAWQGLGYNNRALRLRDCANAIVNMHEGKIPVDYHALLSLPGIGPYTASAIMSFAYGCDISVIDVNIRRIYARLNGYSNLDKMSIKSIESFAEQIYPQGKSSEWIEKKKVKRNEPSHRNIPNRIWRGRIIEFLRNTNEYLSDSSDLLRGVLGVSIDDKDQTWFEETIVPALKKDRLIHYDSSTTVISISQ